MKKKIWTKFSEKLIQVSIKLSILNWEMKLKLKASYQKWDLTQLKDDNKTCKFKFNEDFDIKLIVLLY